MHGAAVQVVGYAQFINVIGALLLFSLNCGQIHVETDLHKLLIVNNDDHADDYKLDDTSTPKSGYVYASSRTRNSLKYFTSL